MSTDEPQNDPAAGGRRDAVREKAQQVQARQSRAHRVRVGVLATTVVAVVAVAAVAVTWTVSSSAAKPKLTPANVHDDGFSVTEVTGVGIASDESAPNVSDGTAAITAEGDTTAEGDAATEATPTTTPTAAPMVDIRVYVDYLSTGSRDFQLANVQQLTSWVSEDAASLTYYPVAMLTAKSNGTKYSQRAAGAAACVATYSPAAFFAYNNALLQQQPAIDTDGLTDKDLAALAIGSGAEGAKTVRACIEDREYTAWAKAATDRALESLPDTDDIALTGTPMVLVNGSPYVGALDDPKEFAQFVLTIASDAYYKATPTPTPAP